MTSKEIIQTIKKEAERKGLSNYRIAKISGFTETQVREWLNGNVSPSINKLVKICEAIDLKIELKPL